ncbi:OmpA family protein [Spirosoma sp. BT702]|uniref:OmpA family protein n=1 Tax=Spirosoma profusum TaxID=2771354 RepID=A0A926XZD4_9BACT|nr:OmpA family protein [Spirosoma profusum]MBD2703066.1 OmpA family protein [Spirosoma profusum]
MKWIKYIVIASWLCLWNAFPSLSQAKPPPQTVADDGLATVKGTILDAETKKPIAGATIEAKNQSGIIQDKQPTNADGTYQLKISPKQTYIFMAKANGYAPFEEVFAFTSDRASSIERMRPTLLYRPGKQPIAQQTQPTTTASAVSQTQASPSTVAPSEITARGTAQPPTSSTSARVAPPKTLDAKIMYTPPPLVVVPGKTTQLKAIQFVQSKAELLPDAQPALEQLLAYMRDHPTTEIELAGHTDNQGDFDENLRLSKQRVDVVKDFLVQGGIAANRITTRGYGPTRPIANNRNEVSRQLNRRVEMIVVKQ